MTTDSLEDITPEEREHYAIRKAYERVAAALLLTMTDAEKQQINAGCPEPHIDEVGVYDAHLLAEIRLAAHA